MGKVVRYRSPTDQASTDQGEDHPTAKARKHDSGALANLAIVEEGDSHIVPTASADNTLAKSVFKFLADNHLQDKTQLVEALMKPESKLSLITNPSSVIVDNDMAIYHLYHEGGRKKFKDLVQNLADRIAAANVLLTVTKDEFLKMFDNNFPGNDRRPFVHFGLQSKTAMPRLEEPFPTDAFGHLAEKIPALEGKVKMMPVLYGESGSGKTHAAMSSNPGGLVVYLLLGDDMEDKFRPKLMRHDRRPTDVDNDPGPEVKEHESERSSHPVDGVRDASEFTPIADDDSMLSDFVNDVTNRCKMALDHGKTEKMQKVDFRRQMKDVVVRVVADELGDKPSVLRLFIRTRESLLEAISKALNCKEVKLLAVGTGVNERVALGSNVNAYAPFTLGVGGTTFVEWLLGQMAIDFEFKQELAGIVKDHRSLGDLVKNRRAAVLVVKHLAHVVLTARVTSVEQLTSLVNETADMVATSSAFDFKGLNGLESLSHNAVKRVALDAIEIVRSRTVLSDHELQRYSARYGILVNTSVDASVQKLGMSPAMRALLLVILGCPQHNRSIGAKGEALEKVLAKKCAIALLTTRDPELLSKMLHTNPMFPVAEECPEPVSQRPEVVMMELTHWLAGAANATQVNATLQEIETHVNNGRAVVVINGSVAPYADVVAVTKGFVGFFQSKDTNSFEPNTEANKLHTKGESKAITCQGVTDELCRIAGVKSENVVDPETGVKPKLVKLVIVSSARRRVGSKDDALEVGVVEAEQVFRRDGISFLFPFDWPEKDTKAQFDYTAAKFGWKEGDPE